MKWIAISCCVYAMFAIGNLGLFVASEKRSHGALCSYINSTFDWEDVFIRKEELGIGISGCPVLRAL